MSYDNTNKGALWVKEAKTSKHPNMSGSINIEGKEYWLSGWSTRNPEGKRPNIRLTAKPKEQQEPDFDDEIPFIHAWAVPLVGLIVGALGAAQYVA